MTATDTIISLQTQLIQIFAPTHLEIVDEGHEHQGHVSAHGGGHFAVIIVSDKFTGHNSVQRHRMVYAAVQQLMQTNIHALSIKAYTPKEF